MDGGVMRGRKYAWVAVAASGMVAASSLASAQDSTPADTGGEADPASAAAPTPDEHERGGFFFRASIGGAWGTDITSSDVFDVSGSNYNGWGGNGQVFFGGGVAPGVVIGGGFTWGVLNGDITEGVFSLNRTSWFSLWGPLVAWYPNQDSGLNVEFMVGMANYEFDGSTFSNGGAFGWGLQAAVGYDWWISNKWSIGFAGQLQYGNIVSNDITNNILIPGILATFTYY